MGMYTELIIKCSIKKDIPQEVRDVLNHLFNGEELNEALSLSLHLFFQLPHWKFIGNSSSYYHVPFALSKFVEEDKIYHDAEQKYYGSYLFSRSDFKNYSNELEAFLDWLDPYIQQDTGYCIGWKWYEEDKEPTLIYKK